MQLSNLKSYVNLFFQNENFKQLCAHPNEHSNQ